MTTGEQETYEYHSACIVDCGWRDAEVAADHPGYCERAVGSKANAVTEPGFQPVQFWCSVISPHINGVVPVAEGIAAHKHRDGVQLVAIVSPGQGGEIESAFNMTPAEARQLAAQLVAAADSHDGINGDYHMLHRLSKVAKKVGAEIYGP